MKFLQHGRRKDESAAEAVAMIFVIPVLIILVLGLIDVGMMFRARMLVENTMRDAARGAAADGGNYNARTNTIDRPWSDWAQRRLYRDGECQIGQCKEGKVPVVRCRNYYPGGGFYSGNTVQKAGHTITCSVDYPYKAINSDLLNSPMGLGIGTLLKEFKVEVSARAETGDSSSFGVG
jgi:hypothetical protein